MKIKETNLKFTSLLNRTSTRKIVLHHAAATTADAKTIHKWHLNNGWSGIGYHFVVLKNGTIERGRPIKSIGAHCTGQNSDSIGICFEGNFEKETMSDKQVKAGQELLSYLYKTYNLTKSNVKRHKDLMSTSCPGKNFPFDKIISGTKTVTNTSSASTTNNTTAQNNIKTSTNNNNISIIKQGQQYAINFTGIKIKVDGIVGSNTKKMKHRVLQHAMNKDYNAKLVEDGCVETASKKALGNHYVKQGEKQYMVTAAEILMYLNGIDPNGVEYPGIYGSGLVKAAKTKFGGTGVKINADNFLSLIN